MLPFPIICSSDILNAGFSCNMIKLNYAQAIVNLASPTPPTSTSAAKPPTPANSTTSISSPGIHR